MSEELPPSERPPQPPSPPRGQWQEEKKLKRTRKTAGKEAEKGGGVDEKYRRDPLGTIIWASILIMAGVIFLANNMGMLPETIGDASPDPWHWIMLGAGGLILFEVLIRSVSPDYARPIGGSLIFACILIAIGLGGFTDSNVIWPVMIMVAGVALLLNAFRQRSD